MSVVGNDPRQAALMTYAKAQDHWSEMQQLYKATGDELEAAKAQLLAHRLLRSYLAEIRGDPPSAGPRNVHDR